MILLDTSVIIAPAIQFPDLGVYGVSMVTLAELEFGVHMADSAVARAHRQARITALRESGMSWHPFDEPAAISYGLLAAEVAKTRPSHARSKDILIAGHAHSLGASVMTLNPKDFELVSHLVPIMAA